MKRRPFGFLICLAAVRLACGAPALHAAPDAPAELIAAVKGGDAARVETLLAAGASPDARDEKGITVLALAAARGNVDLVKILMRHGADVHAKDQSAAASPVVWHTAAQGADETLRLLLQAGAGVNETDAKGVTPLMGAAFFGNPWTLPVLIAAKPDLEARSLKGETALMLAAQGGHYEAARHLLDAGAKVNALADQKATALIFAAEYGFDDVVGLLIERGADPAAKSTPGLTALDLAKQNHRTTTIDLLENGGRQSKPAPNFEVLRALLFPEAPIEAVFLKAERKGNVRLEAVRQLALQGELQKARDLLVAGRDDLQATPEYWARLAFIEKELGNRPAALAAFHKFLAFPNLGSRETLRAWRLMRGMGEAPPPDQARKVLGVVVESGLGANVLTAAAYADGNPRLFLGTGGGLIGEGNWTAEETKDDQEMVRLGQELLDGTLPSANRDLPKPGRVRFTLLTPGGSYEAEASLAFLRIGQGRYARLFAVCDQLVGKLGKRLPTPQPDKAKP